MQVAGSWRLGSVALLSFVSGLPLGVVWLAIPAWMARDGVDIRVVGLFTLAQAPWTFKFLWAPLMDRYAPPGFGRKRGWMLIANAGLLVSGLWLATLTDPAEHVLWIAAVACLIAFFSASFDVAYDAYTVEVLRREEQGIAVGARVALYRAAMWFSGRLSITASAFMGWPLVNLCLALLYLPAALLPWKAPEPEEHPVPPVSLRAAVWEPFVGMLGQHRALEILAFVVLFKLSDNLTQALTAPFLIQVGFDDVDVGVASGTIGLFGMVFGTFLGGLLTQSQGLGRALWITGVLQIVSNLGYAVVAQVGPQRVVMYLATAFEYATSGLGNGAFGVLLLRLTQKRFSATQFALLSSLFTIPRVFAGPPAGLLADAIGWRDFFVFTLLTGLPGLWMLSRFVPWNVRDVEFHVAPAEPRAALSRAGVAWRCVTIATASFGLGVVAMAGLAATRAYRAGRGFPFAAQVEAILAPVGLGNLLTLVGIALTAVLVGLATAALLVGQRGLAAEKPGMEPPPGA